MLKVLVARAADEHCQRPECLYRKEIPGQIQFAVQKIVGRRCGDKPWLVKWEK